VRQDSGIGSAEVGHGRIVGFIWQHFHNLTTAPKNIELGVSFYKSIPGEDKIFKTYRYAGYWYPA
jgi:hypothetical protein